MNRPSLTDRLRYWFDNTMSRGPVALIGWLGLIAGAVVVATSLVTWLIGTDSQATFGEQLWAFLM